MDNYTIQPLHLTTANGTTVINNIICLVQTSYERLHANKEKFLHLDELTRFKSFMHARRQKSFLQGRYAAKLALTQYKPSLQAHQLCIANGVFGFPYISSPADCAFEVNISHSGEYGAAVAFCPSHPMAIDLEKISLARIEAIKSQMTKQELILVTSAAELTMLWSAKEALAKVIKCGLNIDFKLLEIKHINIGSDNNSYLSFKNFPQYKVLTTQVNDYILALVMPAASELIMPAITLL